MASFNKVILIGNLTSDVELKQSTSGVSVCSFSIAVNRKMAKNGECDFINIVAWRQTAEFVSKYFTKGKPILVCGQLQTRSWTDNQGQKRYATEVVADEVSFVGANEEQKKPTENASANGFTPGTTAHMPNAYVQPNFAPQTPQFEEIPSDDTLPF